MEDSIFLRVLDNYETLSPEELSRFELKHKNSDVIITPISNKTFEVNKMKGVLNGVYYHKSILDECLVKLSTSEYNLEQVEKKLYSIENKKSFWNKIVLLVDKIRILIFSIFKKQNK